MELLSGLAKFSLANAVANPFFRFGIKFSYTFREEFPIPYRPLASVGAAIACPVLWRHAVMIPPN